MDDSRVGLNGGQKHITLYIDVCCVARPILPCGYLQVRTSQYIYYCIEQLAVKDCVILAPPPTRATNDQMGKKTKPNCYRPLAAV